MPAVGEKKGLSTVRHEGHACAHTGMFPLSLMNLRGGMPVYLRQERERCPGVLPQGLCITLIPCIMFSAFA